MKSRRLTCILAVTLLAVAMPVSLAAQDKAKHHHHHNYHQYQLIDLGTLGGPNSFLSGPEQQILNNRGTLAAYANTAAANPNPNCYIPFNANGGGGDCFVEHPAVWRHGTLTDLGVLPGGTNGQTDSLAANGLISGWSENGLLDPLTGLPEGHAVLWTHSGKIIDLGTLPGGAESLATANNSSGQVVGFSGDNIPEDPSISLAGLATQTRAFLWQNGAIQDLGTLGGTDSLAFNINERGQTTGFSYTNSDATLNPFFWQNGTMTDIGSLGGTYGVPNWLNNRGQVAGTSNLPGDATNHGFLWDQGMLTDVGTLGGDNSEADWVSDSGFIVGSADVPGSQSHHAYRWRNGVMTDLGIVQPWPCSTALSANSRGQVVGETGICGVGGGPVFFSDHGEPMVDVNTLIVPISDLEVVDALDINDRGEIAGLGVLSNGDVHAVLLIPVEKDKDDDNADSGAAATQSAAPRSLPSGTQRPPQSRWSNRYHIPGLQSPSR
jgi:probable HAF family extracellular repeat protein